MDFERFLNKLWQISQIYEWRIDSAGRIRSAKNDCVLVAVCERETSKTFHPSRFMDAADLLGMDWELANDVVVAADYTNGWRDNPRIMAIREQLLVAIGLNSLSESCN